MKCQFWGGFRVGREGGKTKKKGGRIQNDFQNSEK